MVTDMLVILNAKSLAVPKYDGTNANQIIQVVYIVNPEGIQRCLLKNKNYSKILPICLDSLNASGIFLVSTA